MKVDSRKLYSLATGECYKQDVNFIIQCFDNTAFRFRSFPFPWNTNSTLPSEICFTMAKGGLFKWEDSAGLGESSCWAGPQRLRHHWLRGDGMWNS